MHAILIFAALLAQVSAQPPASLEEMNNRGKAAIAKNDLKGAEDVFRAALNQAKSAGDRGWEAEFQRAIGETYHRRGQLKEAVSYYQASLEVQRARGDQPGIAFLLRGIGDVYRLLREDEKAEAFLEQGRAAYDELGDKKDAAITVQDLAQLRIDQARLADAGGILKQAAELFDVSQDKRDGALVRDQLSEVYLRQSDYRMSLQIAFEALDIQRELAWDPFLQITFERLGNTFLAMEQPEKALSYFQQCLELRKAGNPLAVAQAYSNIGFTLEKLDRQTEALEALSKALELRQGRDSPQKIAETLINIGSAQEALGKVAEAESSDQAALKIAEEHQDSGHISMALYGLGNLALSAGRVDDAIAQHARALSIRQQTGDRIEAVHSRNRLALAYEMKGDLARSEKFHAEALGEFEKIAAGITDPAQVGRFRQSTVILYPHYSQVLLKEGKIESALAIAERSRGVGLARMEDINRRGFSASLSDTGRASWNQAEAARARASNRLQELLANSAPQASVEQARIDFMQADNRLGQVRDEIYARSPSLLSHAVAQPRVPEILASSRKQPETLYLEWLMVDESALLFAVSNGAVRGFQLPVGRDAFARMDQRWLASLEQGTVRGVSQARRLKPDAAVEEEMARQLYQAVFGPVSDELQKHSWSRLVLIPDGPLLDLAFAGLLDEKGSRLIENFPLTTAVSLESVFQAPSHGTASGSLFAVGDPIEPGERRVVAPSGDRYEPLSHARLEAKGVAALFDGSLVLTGAQAREERVKQEMGKYQILHFATHGVLSQTDGLQSGLLLANELAQRGGGSQGDHQEDGLLQAWEIADTPLAADLAVLSACETAEGDERLGEGLMGLAWAFQAAGCPNVVASLWNIDDEATQKIMIEFYRSIREGKRLDEAMRAAMLAVKQSPRTSSPYFWAGFRILGPAGAISR